MEHLRALTPAQNLPVPFAKARQARLGRAVAHSRWRCATLKDSSRVVIVKTIPSKDEVLTMAMSAPWLCTSRASSKTIGQVQRAVLGLDH
jgi:hypothetical protein